MSKKRRALAQAEPNVQSEVASRCWCASYWFVFTVLTVLAIFAYSAAMRGPFLFDDLMLRIASPIAGAEPLANWLSGVRPVLMWSYWLNYQGASGSTIGYHLINVALHAVNALLLFAICRTVFAFSVASSARVDVAAAISASLFLLHPLQTESVAYVAGRSEVLSATFVLAAWLIYALQAGKPIRWGHSAALLFLFGLGAATKEQAVASVPAVLLLTDWHLPRARLLSVIRQNWRLYAPLGVIAALGTLVVARVLLLSKSAGAATGVSPYEYFLTQCRAVLHYLRLFVIPMGQNADPDFPISRSLGEHGAVLALGALLLGLVVLLKQHTLVRYGGLLFLAFLAPTSSVVPLADPVAEHRMYLPIAGLALAVGAILVSLEVPTWRIAAAGALCCALAFFATAERSKVYADGVVFWRDVVEKSPHKARGYPHLTIAYKLAGRCEDAIRHLEQAQAVMPKDYFILLNWAQVYSCAGRPKDALEKLEAARAMSPTAQIHGLIGSILIEQGKIQEAEQALAEAIAKEPPGTDLAHVYRGQLLLMKNDRTAAEKEYRLALNVNPYSPEAAQELGKLYGVTPKSQRNRFRD